MLRDCIASCQEWFRLRDLGPTTQFPPQFSSTPVPATAQWPLCEYFAWRKQGDPDRRLIQLEDKIGIKNLAYAAGVPHVPTLAILTPDSLDLTLHPALQTRHFVLKTNHGWNDLVFVERLNGDLYRLSGKHLSGDMRAKEANSAIRKHFTWWLKHYQIKSEWAVTEISPRLVFAEPLLSINDDFKVFVVGGKALWIDAMAGRWEHERSWGGIFDTEWNLISHTGSAAQRFKEDPAEAVRKRFPRPAQLEKLVTYAERMVPTTMSLLRVDFFQQPTGEFLLGEAAAYSNAGKPHHHEELELQLGQMVFAAMQEKGFLTATP